MSRSRRDLSLVLNDRDIEFDENKLSILDINAVIRNPATNKELSNIIVSRTR